MSFQSAVILCPRKTDEQKDAYARVLKAVQGEARVVNPLYFAQFKENELGAEEYFDALNEQVANADLVVVVADFCDVETLFLAGAAASIGKILLFVWQKPTHEPYAQRKFPAILCGAGSTCFGIGGLCTYLSLIEERGELGPDESFHEVLPDQCE